MNTDKNNTQLPQSSVSVSAFLTGKAKQDFEKWLEIQEVAPYKVMFWDIPKTVQVAYVTEWLDSVGINITIGIDINNNANSCDEYCENCDDCYDTWNPEYEYCVYVFSEIVNNVNTYNSHHCDDTFESRKMATEIAIQKANELYNAKVVEAEH